MLNINELKFDEKGLIPAVVVDSWTKKVLTVAYMNRESLEISIEKGLTCFYSRSRNELWLKGETSGNYQHIVSITADCDNDALVVVVEKEGPACHIGTDSCFTKEIYHSDDRHEFTVNGLYKLLEGRKNDMPEGSYTTKLFIKGVKKIAQKVGEEAVESVVEAVDGNRDRFIYEASDMIYHLLVLMEQMGCSIEDIERELALRHK